MKCYNFNCKDECNEIKRQYCLFKITEEQQKLIARMGENRCKECGIKMVKCKIDNKINRLCTGCGIVWRDKEVVGYCLVNSRRVG